MIAILSERYTCLWQLVSLHEFEMFHEALTCYPNGVNCDANHRSFPSSTQLLIVQEKTKTEGGRDLNQVVQEAVQYSCPKVECVRV
jgi:hypothetical protein